MKKGYAVQRREDEENTQKQYWSVLTSNYSSNEKRSSVMAIRTR